LTWLAMIDCFVLVGILWAQAAIARPLSPATWPPPEPRALRGELLLRVNAERALAGASPLAPAAALDEVAQARAEEIGARGALPAEADALTLFGAIQRRMFRAGYAAHGWLESITVSAGDVDAVIGYWKGGNDYAEALRADWRDVGMGFSRYQGEPLYLFLFAWPESEYWQREITALADLAGARAAMLGSVNAARRQAGRPPLREDTRLDAAAQEHAEDMLARSYYAHNSPGGGTPRQRVLAAGYPAATVAENIAARHATVEAAMAAWLASSDHRRNLLDGRFTDMGIGLAVGSYGHRYQVLWVQDFAAPAGQ
jgi:uncharacterized protein YkwD